MPTADRSGQSSPDATGQPPARSAALRSLSKALVILSALGDLGGRATLSEIVRCCGLAKTTVHRVLAVLVAHDAVLRIGDHYVVGSLLRYVAALEGLYQDANLRRNVKPFLLDVYQRTRQPVALTVLAEQSVWCIDIVFGHDQRDEAPPLIRPAPLHCTAAGKVFLAFDPAASDCLPESLTPYTEHTVTSLQMLAEELAETRREGVARCEMEYTEGIASLAAPVRVGRGRVAAAIEAYGRSDSFPWVAVEAAVRRAALGASSILRHATETSNIRPVLDRSTLAITPEITDQSATGCRSAYLARAWPA
jgi:DNA-binding IclR family transcriptional regulator